MYMKVLVAAVMLLGAVQVCAQDLDTRAGRLQRERQAKSQQLAPYKRNGLESLLFELKDRRIMERYQAGYKGFHPMLGGLATGSGFAIGAHFRKKIFSGSVRILPSRIVQVIDLKRRSIPELSRFDPFESWNSAGGEQFSI